MIRSTESGFSLLEVLVSMTLLGLIGAMSVGAIGFGRTAWDRTEATGNVVSETRVVQKFLARQIAVARPVQVRSGARVPPVWFRGAGDRLQFIAPVQAHLARPGEHLIDIRVEDGVLVLRAEALGSDRPVFRADTPGEPLASAEALFLRYFGPDADTGEGRWHTDWMDRTTLPVLVEVNVSGTRDWPLQVIRLGAAL